MDEPTFDHIVDTNYDFISKVNFDDDDDEDRTTHGWGRLVIVKKQLSVKANPTSNFWRMPTPARPLLKSKMERLIEKQLSWRAQ